MPIPTEKRTKQVPSPRSAREPSVTPKESAARETGAPRPANGNGAYLSAPAAASLLAPNPLGALPERPAREQAASLALFCFEPPESPLGQYVTKLALAAVARKTPVRLFSRYDFPLERSGIRLHDVGASLDGTLLDQVNEYTSRACNAFLQEFPVGSGPVTVLGAEWSTIPTLALLQGTRNCATILSLHSLERQRSDMKSELSQQIEQIELSGLRQARTILIQEPAVGELAKTHAPECASRLVLAQRAFPVANFQTGIDAGAVKARYQIGPIDPTILFIGDHDDRHGPDILMKSMPAILKDTKQARAIFVGDGSLFWPCRVFARYLLIEPSVRLVGHVEGKDLAELVQAADIIVAPSREPTEWWPLQAAWAASKPVVTTHSMAPALGLVHEENSILTYPHESSCVWGVNHLMHNWDLAAKIGAAGAQRVDDRFGWSSVAAQIEQLMAVAQPRS